MLPSTSLDVVYLVKVVDKAFGLKETTTAIVEGHDDGGRFDDSGEGGNNEQNQDVIPRIRT